MNKIVLTAVLSATTAAAFAQTASVNTGADTGNELQEVVVTGTLIRGEAPTGSPVQTVSAAQIAATGTTNTADLLATVPSMTSFNTTPIGGNQEFRSGGQTIPGMRGLPGTAVLVMIDGHRLVGDSPLLTTADPSSIPPEAIDHIEVVQDGGSATYGSDAVAGVINIILKKNFNGAESYGSYTAANDYNAGSFGQLFGKTWTGGSALFDFHYENNSALYNSDREFYDDDLRPQGGVDGYTTTCGPAQNIRLGSSSYYNAITGAPEAGLNVTQAATCNPNATAQLIYPNRRYALVGDIRQDIGEKIHLTFDAKYTDDKSSGLYNPQTLQINNAGFTGIPQGLVIPGPNIAADNAVFGAGVITAGNPYYYQPPNVPCVGGAGTATCLVGAPETVYANSGVFGPIGNIVNQFHAQSAMFDIGGSYDLTKTWEISTDFDFGISTSTALNPDSSSVNPGALYAAEIGTTTSTALDPFGPMTNPNVAAGIMNWPLLFKAIQRVYDYNLKADGSVVTLPGGDVKLAIGGAERAEQYVGEDPIGVPGATAPVSGVPSFTPGNYQSHTRYVHAVDGELSLPIFGAGNALPGLQKLSVSVAGRYDHYSDFGGTSNPKYGITWSPIQDVALRATYGTSFHAPQLADIYAIDTRVSVTQVQPGVNPASYPGNIAALIAAGEAPGGTFPTIYTIGMPGGKPGLKPETAKTGTFGVDFTPSFLPGFRANITNFLIRYFNEVEIPTTPGTAASTNFCNPSYSELYTFNGSSNCASNPTLAGVPASPLSAAQLNAVLTGLRFYAPFSLAQVESLGLPVYLVSSAQRQNIGTTDIDGWDFDFNYVRPVPFGLLATDLSGEYLYKFQSQTAPGAAFVDNLKSGSQYFQNDAGAQDIIPWHFRYTLGLQNGPVSQQAAVNYTGHYNYLYSQYNYVASPTGKTTPAIQWVQEFITIDYSLNYAFPQDEGFLKGLKAQFNVYNVLNQQPPFVYITGTSPSAGFNSASASPLGRTFRISLDKRW